MLEADLDRFWHRDLKDLWRSDERGPRLTWRQLWVRINTLPANSALAIDDNGGTRPWSMTEHLLADVWVELGRARLGKKAPRDHPAREKQKQVKTAFKGTRKRGAHERAKARRARALAGRTT